MSKSESRSLLTLFVCQSRIRKARVLVVEPDGMFWLKGSPLKTGKSLEYNIRHGLASANYSLAFSIS